jgi:activator of 2-hydroxyglutaryl-CoA dehydratase
MKENTVNMKEVFPTFQELDMNQLVLLRNNVPTYEFTSEETIDVFLGIDIGSVSTNLVVVDTQGNVVKEVYLMTAGRPIEVVSNGFKRN